MIPAQALEHSQNLQALGFPQGQADGIVRLVGQMQRESEENLVTKDDLAKAVAGIMLAIAQLEARLTWRIVIALLGGLAVQTAIVGIIVKVL